jgi:hypothetical protein
MIFSMLKFVLRFKVVRVLTERDDPILELELNLLIPNAVLLDPLLFWNVTSLNFFLKLLTDFLGVTLDLEFFLVFVGFFFLLNGLLLRELETRFLIDDLTFDCLLEVNGAVLVTSF